MDTIKTLTILKNSLVEMIEAKEKQAETLVGEDFQYKQGLIDGLKHSVNAIDILIILNKPSQQN